MSHPLESLSIAVLAGGNSKERQVSLNSGKQVLSALKEKQYTAELLDIQDPQNPGTLHCDIAFIALHGENGEDGVIQAELEKQGIPYTGSGVLASEIAMDKQRCKTLMRSHHLPTAASFSLEQALKSEQVPYPLVLKPISGGSSIDIHVIESKAALRQSQSEQNTPTDCFLEEQIIGTELTVGIIEKNGEDLVLPALELRPPKALCDYDAKYTKGLTEFIIPSNLPTQTVEHCQSLALALHKALGCQGLSRTDFIVHPQRGPFILELNTIPGLTAQSYLPTQAAHIGISFPELVEHILIAALEKQH